MFVSTPCNYQTFHSHERWERGMEHTVLLLQFVYQEPTNLLFSQSFCSNLFPDQIVCVGVGNPTGAPPSCPVPVKPGVISNCDDCYKVVEGDSCQAILDANNITVAELLAWNPDLNSECSNLEIGYNYCVGVSESL